MADRRADAATAAVGYTGVAGGALLREKAVRAQMPSNYGKRPPHPLKTAVLQKTPTRIRLQHGGGLLIGGLSAIGAEEGTRAYLKDRFGKAEMPSRGTAALRRFYGQPEQPRKTRAELLQDKFAVDLKRKNGIKPHQLPSRFIKRDDDPLSLVTEGVRGNVAAVQNAVKPKAKNHPDVATRAASVGLGLLASRVGSRAAGKYVVPKLASQHAHVAKPIGGTAAAALAYPISAASISRYTRRKRKKAIKPSTQAYTGASLPRQSLRTSVTKMGDASEYHTNRPLTPPAFRQRLVHEVTGLSPREQRGQLERRKRQFAANVATTGTGLAGLGLLAASSKRTKLPVHVAERARRAATTTAVIGGGVGAIGGLQGLSVQHKDIQGQKRTFR